MFFINQQDAKPLPYVILLFVVIMLTYEFEFFLIRKKKFIQRKITVHDQIDNVV